MSDKKKKLKLVVKLVVKAGEATAGPPIGTALGPHGINLGMFCKSINADTLKKFDKSTPVPIRLSIYEDKSFSYTLGLPQMSYLIKKALKIEKGSSEPKKNIISSISMDDVKKIAELKMSELTACDLEAAMKTVAGSARSMGIEVK